ncbi:MAG: 16S rRNA (cytosine(1402)-N(4))-methyltransferase RsmH [Candidatus Marinimicrobia bacterium]|mgnify:FL=1|nr:16S rRNA (cytosine(1402)-N(4))-methyltransferase RsmH [Candidatus Neomarinimicrobiota bacterium]MBT4054017.1 16S rRNA (cytosine(1402)-N(4))-methyltransferase RsmH [Candidatus Neomarinimicrobiota bacterium]MBT5721816.1 16S rRNA (cytosine(1402)-N(4))-methyltransferase RsmH [Candidatus Neomarinimicrobiota bacterium]MBT6516541.1 16S rRNA (cytosine(1402)-N(4))-methyltransferase RsmH [Candidatus Neomarinimicrobiota bacterium]MBT6980930.1 16S rRNA (cytosine(1402)-N(4))-methyltransferase RsmH [Candi
MIQGRQSGTQVHVPVLPKEVIFYLNISTDGIYLDGTVGLGGHAALILDHLSPKGHLIGTDRDNDALLLCNKRLSGYPTPVSLFHNSYHNFNAILDELGIDQVNGFILDLGLSSLQMDSHVRGFSYSTDSDLDMRFDSSQEIKASGILNHLSENDLANVIFQYGEERRSRAIAKSIVKMRPLTTVFDLVESIRRSTPPNHRDRTLARVFQAIRIKVNGELEKLENFLSTFRDRLVIGGRVAIISFHSLEDRLVKHSFKDLAKEGVLSILTKKPVIATNEEMAENRRSRSAKLRVAERIS